MAVCNVCGNDYERAFTINMDNQSYTFDSFECAIFKLAPKCDQCGCQILGHGIEAGSKFYCCAHCARGVGISNVKDHA